MSRKKAITESERYKIECMLDIKCSVADIAKYLGRDRSAVYREIKKGTVKQMNSDLTYKYVYKADYAQRVTNERLAMRGAPLKIGNDIQYANHIEQELKKGYSPRAVLYNIKKSNTSFHTSVSYWTIYKYMKKGVFLNVTENDLLYPRKGKKKSHKREKRPAFATLGAKHIEDRGFKNEDRETFGNWELDTVVGKKKTKSCLLVLTERMTRNEIIRKMESKTKECVVAAFDKLENELGSVRFRQLFKTITCDNGSEFYDWKGIEKDSRTQLFYAHPYAPHERGSNENNNRFIRRFVPKGVDIGEYTDDDIMNIQNYINYYPRGIFNGLSSNEILMSLCNINNDIINMTSDPAVSLG